ncbi:MAG: TldD/PmbA family protein [Treponema sp. GWB1_62_6]|nr:MAG: TldD/PmbA family protein [Treponema sp. GWC1_61_84]OHE67738.1 MAG: TldD/PmbA family protein [Treponema sp. GWB1_62_6]OHE75620.1 MAG: TldD/PmbA family protein [Treponema sp. RIFOXYC1_FULL_61_9]HCM27548.1 TldD/PmbA family protein [Treponema sp.]
MEEFNGIDIARKAVDLLRKAGADKAQASLYRKEKSELNVDAGAMSLYRTTANVSMNLTALVGDRKGSLSLNRYDETSVRAAAAEAVDAARSSLGDSANDISPADTPERRETGDTDPSSGDMYDRLREFVDYSRRTYPKTVLEQCILDFENGASFYSNSNGAEFEERSGRYDFSAMFTTKDGRDVSSFNYSGASRRSLAEPLKAWGGVDELMRQSTEQTRVSSVEGSFTGDLIMAPDSLGDFLQQMDQIYLSDHALITGTSPWKEALGARVVSPLFTMRSEPGGPGIRIGYLFTRDGFRAENCPLIERGVLRNFTLGLFGSNKTGKPRCPSGGAAVIVEPGDSSLPRMIADVKRGLLMARFSGGGPADNGDFSGVAKNSYLIENGRIVRPVGETMIAGNIASLLGSVRAVSSERIDYGQAVLPWVLAGGVTISGK